MLIYIYIYTDNKVDDRWESRTNHISTEIHSAVIRSSRIRGPCFEIIRKQGNKEGDEGKITGKEVETKAEKEIARGGGGRP